MILLLLRRKTSTEPLNKIVWMVPARSKPEKIVTSRSELETDQESDQLGAVQEDRKEENGDKRWACKVLQNGSYYANKFPTELKFEDGSEFRNFTHISTDYGDELTWAAAWLYKATSESQYLDEAEHNYMKFRLKERPNEFFYNKKVAGVQTAPTKDVRGTIGVS
uniref:cellulase n=1 Tax=Timema douglasi TaxID=61478 RepID=A0A7R8VLE0_TIMDO|nr:unnamed protein product [Timema douglasi]